jgi:Spy/CpxP family protein refolding chaperone
MMGGGPGMRGMGSREDRMPHERPLITLMLRQRQQLGLSDDQVTKLRGLRSSFEKETIRTRADIRIAELDLDELLDQNQVDLAKAEAVVRKEEGLRTNLRLARINAIEQAKALLTPEQRQRLQRLVDAMPGMGSGPGMMGHGMMGPGMAGPGAHGPATSH